jgi:phenylacetic acid degradation operon negative regulatory protein
VPDVYERAVTTMPGPAGPAGQGRPGGAKAVLYTILGEFVLPAGGAAWTATLVAAFDLLGVTEKNARQALARVADQGTIVGERHGRQVRWQLTASGRSLLEAGADRIYQFGAATDGWNGEWLVAHCPVPETQRALRHRLRTELSFVGFGELAASLAVSPHVGRQPVLHRILRRLTLTDDCLVLRSRTGSAEADLSLARRAWDLDGLGASYRSFAATHRAIHPSTPEAMFRANVELVHDWRRFPSIDPELPTELLASDWAGTTANLVFEQCRQRWSPGATEWFVNQDRTGD